MVFPTTGQVPDSLMVRGYELGGEDHEFDLRSANFFLLNGTSRSSINGFAFHWAINFSYCLGNYSYLAKHMSLVHVEYISIAHLLKMQ